MSQAGLCTTCGEPLHHTPYGLIGNGGVCRDPHNPNDDDEGQHILDDLADHMAGAR